MPKPLPKISICLGSSCFARGNSRNMEILEQYLNEHGLRDEVDVDLSCSLCQGRCSAGPNISVDGVAYSKVTPGMMLDLLKAKFGAKNSVKDAGGGGGPLK